MAILAAGSGTRFGGDKTLAHLGGKPVWKWSFDTFSQHSNIDYVFVVTGNNASALSDVPNTPGGHTRAHSSNMAVRFASDYDILLIHDAARPFVSNEVIDRVLAGIKHSGAAAAVVPVVDTIRTRIGEVVDRESLMAMQTPQGARLDLLQTLVVDARHTDDVDGLRAQGHPVEFVAGDPSNFKITTQEDLIRARQIAGFEFRTGMGYDIHAFSTDPSRTLFLGGVAFPGELALEGHSDADAALHAVADAVLGGAGLGDIGVHFPPTDERWRGSRSTDLLSHVGTLVRNAGWEVTHVDLTIIAERPKVQTRASEMKIAISHALNLSVDRVSIKATTNEGLGSIGRAEGIAAMAVATLRG